MLQFMTEHDSGRARLPSMWLVCALIVLLTVGLVLPCELDIAMTPDSEFTTFSKGTWMLIAGAFWIFGCAAWLAAGRPQRPSLLLHRRHNPYPADGYGQAEALQRHPAAQAAASAAEPASQVGYMTVPRPLGPDDDDAFLLHLDQMIRDSRDDGAAGAY